MRPGVGARGRGRPRIGGAGRVEAAPARLARNQVDLDFHRGVAARPLRCLYQPIDRGPAQSLERLPDGGQGWQRKTCERRSSKPASSTSWGPAIRARRNTSSAATPCSRWRRLPHRRQRLGAGSRSWPGSGRNREIAPASRSSSCASHGEAREEISAVSIRCFTVPSGPAM